MWTPITLEELKIEISKSELELNDEELNFWYLVRISPEKWQEEDYGNDGGGFWAVGIFGKQVLWYNDIEDGFNISNFTDWGKIEQYWCNQEELFWVIRWLYRSIQTGEFSYLHRGGPDPLS